MHLSRKELQSLIEKQTELAVSIYMPTHRTGDIKQDPIRLNNLLKEAEEKLKAMELSSKETKELLKPIVNLLSDGSFWSHQGDALALFFTGGFFRFFKLPYDFQELVVASSRFHIKPLVPLFVDIGLFYVLALSQNEARLIQCTSNSEREVIPDGLPPSLSEVLFLMKPKSNCNSIRVPQLVKENVRQSFTVMEWEPMLIKIKYCSILGK